MRLSSCNTDKFQFVGQFYQRNSGIFFCQHVPERKAPKRVLFSFWRRHRRSALGSVRHSAQNPVRIRRSEICKLACKAENERILAPRARFWVSYPKPTSSMSPRLQNLSDFYLISGRNRFFILFFDPLSKEQASLTAVFSCTIGFQIRFSIRKGNSMKRKPNLYKTFLNILRECFIAKKTKKVALFLVIAL